MIETQDLKRMLPVWYENIYEPNLLMDIEQQLFDEFVTQINRAQSNQYISTADSETIALYEMLLGITVNPGDSLSVRRFRVLTRLTTKKSYTMRYLQEVLSSFGDPVNLTMFYDEYRLLVEMNFEKLGQVSEIEYIFRSVIPANILMEAHNELKLNVPTKYVYIAAGMVNTELVMITQDVSVTPEIKTPVYQPFGVVVSNLEQTSQDISLEPEINLQPKSSNGFVNYQRIEIIERGE